MIRFIILILFSFSLAHGSEIEKAFRAKNYGQVASIYLSNSGETFKEKEYVMISYSLRRQGKFREDLRVTYSLVKKFYSKQHAGILNAIRTGESLDSNEIPEPLKIHYWNLFNNYASILKQYSSLSEELDKDQKNFNSFTKILSEVEFREGKVDKISDAVQAHIQYLHDKIYHWRISLSIQYVSWQQTATLIGPSDSTTLIITNRALCTGGDLGLENYLFHFYMDGCFLYGAGAVRQDSGAGQNYQQSNIPAYGVKVGPGASVIVSSSGSRIGIKIPFLYSVQQLTTPTTPGYSISDKAEFAAMTTLYSRWQFDKWYFQTEFGKYVKNEEAFWGIGFGRNF